MIEASHLWRHYGDAVALADVSFRLEPGETVGLLGPNGAGKTTALRILAGLLAPTGGEVLVDGRPSRPGDPARRRLVSFLPERALPYPELRVDEYLRLRADLRGLDRDEIELALRRCELVPHRRRIVEQLSKGLSQRVCLAAALLGSPPVLLLDEPTSGLDPGQVLETRRLIAELAPHTAILLSTHVLREVEASCRRVVLLDGGRVVASGDMADLLASRRGELLCRCRGVDATALREALETLPLVKELRLDGETSGGIITMILRGEGGDDCAAATASAVHRLGGELLELRPRGDDLESFFEAMTEHEAAP